MEFVGWRESDNQGSVVLTDIRCFLEYSGLKMVLLWSPINFKGRISPFLFLKDKLFELYGIFTVAFIKYKKY